MTPRIRCAVCDKIVDKHLVEYDKYERRYFYTVWCHGAKETRKIDESFMAEVGSNIARGMSDGTIEGVAFDTLQINEAMEANKL